MRVCSFAGKSFGGELADSPEVWTFLECNISLLHVLRQPFINPKSEGNYSSEIFVNFLRASCGKSVRITRNQLCFRESRFLAVHMMGRYCVPNTAGKRAPKCAFRFAVHWPVLKQDSNSVFRGTNSRI